MPETRTEKDSTTSAIPSEVSLPMTTTSSQVPPPEVDAHSNDIPMSHVEERPDLDSAEGESSPSETQGSATVQNHEDAKTALEKLLSKLNSARIPNHMNTGLSLRMVNSYQLEQCSPSAGDDQTTTDARKEALKIDSTQRTQYIATDAASTPSAQLSSSQSNQQPRAASNTQPSIPMTIPNPYYSGIHYRRILVCVCIFVLVFQVLFALALGGVFGEWGYLLASIFLVVLLVVSAVVVIDGVRQRMWEIQMENRKT